VSDNSLKDRLMRLHSGQTNQRLGRIPLVLGMPVMMSTNFDVDAGVVNGCTGILKQILYRTDSDGKHHTISCVVHAPNMTGDHMPGLPQHYVVALEDTIEMKFIHPHSKRKCKIRRTQVPILPAFTMTAHKAQGQTLSKVVVDLESCRGTEAPYVMVSHVKTLDGLLIMRPFSKHKIMSRQSEDTRREMQRLELLRLQTIVRLGSADESANTQMALAKTNFRHQIGNDEDLSGENLNSGDPARHLARMQIQNQYLTGTDGSTLVHPTKKTHPRTNGTSSRRPSALLEDTPMEVDPPESTTILGKRSSSDGDQRSSFRRKRRRV
jgi:hypothetical protein